LVSSLSGLLPRAMFTLRLCLRIAELAIVRRNALSSTRWLVMRRQPPEYLRLRRGILIVFGEADPPWQAERLPYNWRARRCT